MKNRMTIGDLVDMIDVERCSTADFIVIADPNDESITTELPTCSTILESIGGWKVGQLRAAGEGKIKVWLADDFDK